MELPDSKKHLLWEVIKQVAIGTELKHIQMPIFALQPRSLLEKLTDTLVHPEILFNVPLIPDAEQRFLSVVKFYLSGFHYRPQGMRSPLNPIIGETFKCQWNHASSKSYFCAEQISHHPPLTAFIFYNIEQGVTVDGNLKPSYLKYHGNSVETTIGGMIKLHVFRNENECYEMTYPGVVIRGILFGSLSTEIVGKVTINCEKTGYHAEIEFKPRSATSGNKSSTISGTIKRGDQNESTMYTLSGCWDSITYITDSKTKQTHVLFDSNYQIISFSRCDTDDVMGSRRVWDSVARGILNQNEVAALKAKTAIEESQRVAEKYRKENNIICSPKLFDNVNDFYYYNQWSDIKEKSKYYQKYKGSKSRSHTGKKEDIQTM